MNGKLALAFILAFGLIGGVASAASYDPNPGRAVGVITTGEWMISATGVLTWNSGVATPDAQWYAERSRQLAEIQADLDCQINGCAP